MAELEFDLFATVSMLGMTLPLAALWFYNSPPVQGQGRAWRWFKKYAYTVIVLYAISFTWVMIHPLH